MLQHDIRTHVRVPRALPLLVVVPILFISSCATTTIVPNVINVRASRFAGGAKGDGTTDDLAAIQAAIDSIPVGQSGTVFIPEGTYKITAAIRFGARTVHLECANSQNTVIHQVTPDQSGIVVSDYSSVRNCRILGTNVPRPAHASGIDGGGTTQVTIWGNIIEEWQTQGMVTGDNSSWWTVQNNVIRNNHDEGVLFGVGTTDCVVDGNDIYGNWKNGLDFNGPRHTIVNNSLHANGHTVPVCVSDCNGMILFAASYTTDIYDVVMANNNVHSNANFGIWIGSSGVTSIYNISIDSNMLSGNGLTGIKLEQASSGNIRIVSIHNNSSIQNGVGGLLLDNHLTTNGVLTGVLVSSNEFMDNTGWGLWIYDSEVTDTTVIGNVALHNTPGAVLDAGTNTSFGDNCWKPSEPICAELLNRRRPTPVVVDWQK